MIEKSGRTEMPSPAATIALPISAPSVAYVVAGSAAGEEAVGVAVHHEAGAHQDVRLGAEVVDADPLLGGQRVVGAQARDRRALDELVGDERRRHLVAGQHVDQAQVERALGETLLDVDLPAVDHLDAARAVPGVQVAQGGREQARRTRC